MRDTGEFERTLAYGDSAITYLKANRIPAYPRNYELWYTYSAGFNRQLNQAINAALKAFGSISAELTDKLYEEHLSPLRHGDRIGEVSQSVSTEIEEIIRMLEAAGGSVGAYGSSLRVAANGLGKADSIDQARNIVESIIRATRDMEENNSRLETQLTESRRQIADLQDSLETIRFESMTDQLTGLANRKHFDEALQRHIEASRRENDPMTLIMCDIDHFKRFNDTFGHQTGDQVLRLVSAAIRNNVKGRDVAARYGGEEFGIVLPHTGLDDGLVVAEQIRAAVMAKELVKRSTGESLGRVTMSFGVATLRADETPDLLVARADACLYASKRNGRNRVTAENDPLMSKAQAVA